MMHGRLPMAARMAACSAPLREGRRRRARRWPSSRATRLRGALPPGGLGKLWDILRLTVVYFEKAARCASRERERPASALAAAAQVVQYLRLRIVDDASRAWQCRSELSALAALWLPTSPSFTETQFLKRWAHSQVLCALGEGWGASVQLRLSAGVG